MKKNLKKFLKDSEIKGFDKRHRKILNFNISRYHEAVEKGKKQFSDLELARKKVYSIKQKSVNDLYYNILEFEKNFKDKGGKVIWASDSNEAIKNILEICKDFEIKFSVKSKSMITEEIELNHRFEDNNIESVETDLGEFIVQISNDKPYHIITPVMHRSKEDISKIFNKVYGTDINLTPEQITKYVRELLRKKFTDADLGITGGNFLIADTGSVCLTENEGNGVMTMSFPKVMISIVGIDKIVKSVDNLSLIWPTLSTLGTGQKITVYNSIISGPKKENELDGPEKMYVIILDNGRTNLLNNIPQRESMYCIRCGACINNCPIYKSIGGHTYNTTYSGPIGSVISPLIKNFSEYKHLSFSSSLCGKCSSICPSKINLHELLLENRSLAIKTKNYKFIESISIKSMTLAFLNRRLINLGNNKIKNLFIKIFFSGLWGKRRNLPTIKKKSFNKLWKENHAK